MNLVNWSDDYSVTVTLIDNQHKKLVNLTNTLYAICEEKNSDKRHAAFLQCVQDAVNYTGYHFGTEETIMKKIDYPFFDKHYREHQDFVAKVLALTEELKKTTSISSVSFVHFLKFWILNHIAKTDKDMGNYIEQLRQRNALKDITIKIKKVRSVIEDPVSKRQTVSCRYLFK